MGTMGNQWGPVNLGALWKDKNSLSVPSKANLKLNDLVMMLPLLSLIGTAVVTGVGCGWLR